jgi:hypothetical protein
MLLNNAPVNLLQKVCKLNNIHAYETHCENATTNYIANDPHLNFIEDLRVYFALSATCVKPHGLI